MSEGVQSRQVGIGGGNRGCPPVLSLFPFSSEEKGPGDEVLVVYGRIVGRDILA